MIGNASWRLVSTNVFALLEQNELNSVARQLDYFTGKNSGARPWLLIGRAWLAAYTGQLSSVEPILKQVETEIDNLKSELELQTLGGHIAAIRAYTNWIGDKRDIAASAARVALDWLPEDERLIRCQAATLLGLTLPDFGARRQAFEQALAYARECPVSHVTIFAHGCWAWYLAMQGDLHAAHAACLEAIRLSKSSSSYLSLPTLSHVYTTLSAVLLEWNDLDSALHYSKEAVTWRAAGNRPTPCILPWIIMATPCSPPEMWPVPLIFSARPGRWPAVLLPGLNRYPCPRKLNGICPWATWRLP